MWAPSLGWEDPLEKEMSTHSSILAWKIPWTEEPGTAFPLGWPWEAQSSPRVARESWGFH